MSHRLIATLAGLAALALTPAAALGHSELVSTSPDAGANLQAPPEEVVMTFDTELQPDGSGFVVSDEGTHVGAGSLDLEVAERNVLRGSVEIDEPGIYTVSWTSMSQDGHESAGTFEFGYRADAAPAGVPDAPDTAVRSPFPAPAVMIGAMLILAAIALAARRSSPMSPLLLALPLVLAACVDTNRPGPATCEAASIEIGLALTAEAMEPSDPAACRDQDVTLVVDSEVDGVLHIHGYDDAVPATSVTAGETLELSFTANRSGQFPVELHTEDDTQGVSVGIFTVHEP